MDGEDNAARTAGTSIPAPSGIDPGPRRVRDAALQIFAGASAGLVAAVIGMAFAAVLLSGPAAGFLPRGLALALFGTLVASAAAALRRGYRGVLWQLHSIVIIVLANAVAAVVVAMAGEPDEVVYATLFALIAISTFVTGVVMLAVGTARLARVAKSIPYPVIGGFFAATGILLLKNGLLVGAAAADFGPALLAPRAIAMWGPPVVAGVLIAVGARSGRLRLALPLGALLYLVAFYAVLAGMGQSLPEARAAGLLLDSPGAYSLRDSLPTVEALGRVGFGVLLDQTAAILTVAGLALLGALFCLSGIEHMTGRPLDLDRELRWAGGANLVAGLGGGLVGYVSPALTQLVAGFGAPSRLAALAALGVTLVLYLVGPQMIALLPRGLFTLILAYLGTDFLITWLWIGLRRMPGLDVATVVVICGIALVFGFPGAVAVGLVVASLSFTVSYARVEPVRAATSGRLRPSSVERGEAEARLLADLGDRTAIFELQGFLFFGSANRIHDQVADRIAAARGGISAVVLDFRRVDDMDVSAVQMFQRIARRTEEAGVELFLSRLTPALRRVLTSGGFTGPARHAATLDDALARIEAGRLAEADAPGADAALLAPEVAEMLRAAEAMDPRVPFAVVEVEEGGTVFTEGATDRGLAILETGRLAAFVGGGSGAEVRVARFLPGAIVGEVAFVTGTPRTATVRAEAPSRLRLVTRADIDRLAERDPEAALGFERFLARVIAGRLMRTTALVRALER